MKEYHFNECSNLFGISVGFVYSSFGLFYIHSAPTYSISFVPLFVSSFPPVAPLLCTLLMSQNFECLLSGSGVPWSVPTRMPPHFILEFCERRRAHCTWSEIIRQKMKHKNEVNGKKLTQTSWIVSTLFIMLKCCRPPIMPLYFCNVSLLTLTSMSSTLVAFLSCASATQTECGAGELVTDFPCLYFRTFFYLHTVRHTHALFA